MVDPRTEVVTQDGVREVQVAMDQEVQVATDQEVREDMVSYTELN